ncbi:MAG: hypothetical protein KJP00_00420 [Bacteroidia bacterium]|nr:hypothetical protein [Bacteroidia bacterium]
MKKILTLVILVNIIFTACECSYQYDVYVKNSSSQELKISYFSKNDRLSSNEQTLTLKAGESQRIISSNDIRVPEGCSGIHPDHSKFVAEYITAINASGRESKLKWGDPSIKLQREDIQQGSFTMEFTNADF